MNGGNILFIISDTGGGHRSAADAMIAAIKDQAGGKVRCTVTDLLRETDVPLVRNAPEIYGYCSTKQVWLHDLFFRFTNEPQRLNWLSKMVYAKAKTRIHKIINESQPDVVVVAHPLAVRLMCAARREMRSSWSLVTVVTDLATIHASWAYADNSDRYYVATIEAQQALQNYGVSLDRIVYGGFPVHPKFLAHVPGREQARQELGIRKDRTTVLVTSGGAGGGNVGEFVSAIETARPNWQVIVVTGNNKGLFRALVERKNASVTTHVYGFVNKMEMMMAAADVVVTKAGPGTIMEALSLSRPLIVTGAVGLQETGNITYVEKNGFGIYCPEPEKIVEAIGKAGRIGVDLARKQDRAFVVDGSARIVKNILEQDLGGDRKYQTA